MDYGKAYDVAELMLKILNKSVRTEEDVHCVLSCMHRLMHKDKERARLDLDEETGE